jgi:oligoendopeptidase F
MTHEGGHAIHSFLSRDLELKEFKEVPSEVAELASMSMELLSTDHWNVFYTDDDDLKRAKLEHLESILYFLPFCMMIDKFQHWVYTNNYTAQQRKEKWNELQSTFASPIVDWRGYENIRANSWQNTLHLYEVPFYFIEYGMAQLGAFAMWRSYKQLGEQGLDNYMNALKLGYTKTIGEIYETAGIKFDFSASYVKELADFIKEELEKLS